MGYTGAVKEQLTNALLSAFRKPQELEQMVSFKLEVRLWEVVAQGALRDVVFALIDWAESQGRLVELVHGAHLQNPRNPLLLQFHDQFFSLARPQVQQLEKIIVGSNPFHDVAWWRAQQEAHELRICRVESGIHRGTGFLVAPNIILTNHHVVKSVIEGHQSPKSVRFRFDFKRHADGVSVPAGTVYSLASDWLVDSSPADPVDSLPEPKTRVPDPGNLDYALLRMDGEPGREVVNGGPRGVIPIPHAPAAFNPGGALMILQHPKGDPLQIAFDTNAIIGVNGNGTRVFYRTNTLPGSSGSPCFSMQWELVALHHSGEPGRMTATYNEGIPILALRCQWEKKGVMQLLGG